MEVIVSSTLEDVAGNNFKDLLDHTVNVETLDIHEITRSITLKGAPD